MVKPGSFSPTKKLALAALIAAAAIIVHTVEALLPPLIPGIPVRLGLANVFTLLALMLLGAPYAAAVAIVRCVVAVLITGAVSQLPYSLAGALLSFAAMFMLEPLRCRGRLSAVGESVFGAFAFNLGQLGVGILIAGRAMFFYFPVMSLLSVPTGIFTGLIAHYIFKALSRNFNAEQNR
jgi:heptaprenyl diphosphate synthase